MPYVLCFMSLGDAVVIVKTYWYLVVIDQNHIVHILQYQLKYYTHTESVTVSVGYECNTLVSTDPFSAYCLEYV